MSTLAGDTAKIILFGLAIYSVMRLRVCFSISDGWSPIGTLTRCQQPTRSHKHVTNLGQAGQIDQSKAEDMWRVNLEVNGLSVDALVISSYPRCLVLNLPLDLAKILEPPAGQVVELRPFVLCSNACRRVWCVDLIVIWLVSALAGDVDELQNQRSSSDNAASSREKVLSNDVF